MKNELLAADEQFIEVFLAFNTVSLALDVSYNRFRRSIDSLGSSTILSQLQAQLLEVLLSRANKKVSHNESIKILHHNEISDEETLLRMLVRNLRKKLSLYPSIKTAITTEIEGYSWHDPLDREGVFTLPPQKPITADGLVYDFLYRGIMTGDKKIHELPQSYKLLEPLISLPNTMINYETLIKLIWGQDVTYNNFNERGVYYRVKDQLYKGLDSIRPGLSSNIGTTTGKGLLWHL